MTVWGSSERASSFSFESLPNPEVKNLSATTLGGKLVGGSSGVNGMFFDRPSRFDWDAYVGVGSPEFDEHEEKWDWESIFPYYRKVQCFSIPKKQVALRFLETPDILIRA
jgi:choline dehydrogenase-like flavoprotein